MYKWISMVDFNQRLTTKKPNLCHVTVYGISNSSESEFSEQTSKYFLGVILGINSHLVTTVLMWQWKICWRINPYWQISGRPFYWKNHPDQMLHIKYGFSQKIRMDEFSSKTACVTTWKMKISEKFLDKFSMICQ